MVLLCDFLVYYLSVTCWEFHSLIIGFPPPWQSAKAKCNRKQSAMRQIAEPKKLHQNLIS